MVSGIPPDSVNQLYDVTWQNDTFYAVGDQNRVLQSTTGTAWAVVPTNTNNSPLYRIQWLNNTFVAVGVNGLLTMLSPDPMVDTRSSQTVPTNGATLNALAYDGSAYLAMGEIGNIFLSPDLNGWSNQVSGFLDSVFDFATFGNGESLAVGENGQISYSSNGIDWADRRSVGAALFGAASNGDVHVAVGANGTMLSSNLTGENWDTRTFSQDPVLSALDLNAVTWANNQFIAVGNSGLILTSDNGVDWIQRTSGTPVNLQDVNVN